MHEIKRYANGRLYDSTVKKYISMEEIEELFNSGEAFRVIVSKTGEDITETIVEKITEKEEAAKREAAEKMDTEREEPASVFFRLLKKSGGTFAEFSQKPVALFQAAVTMAEDEFDKRVKQLVKGKQMSESEARRLKDEFFGVSRNVRGWLGDMIEKRVKEAFSKMNLVTRDQVAELTLQIEELTEKIETLERIVAEREDTSESVFPNE